MNGLIPHLRPWIIEDDQAAVVTALSEKAICDWKYSVKLAEALKEFAGLSACELYATGTLAIRASLLSLDLPQGSGIAIPAFTCEGVLHGVISAGYKPYIVDCDSLGLMSAEIAKKAYDQGQIRACMAVHQFGMINREIGSLTKIIPVIEDCSHVPPKRHLDGSMAVCGSLEGTKLVGAGEGGYLLHDGRSKDRPMDQLGRRLSDLISVLALRQMERLAENIQRRASIAERYCASWRGPLLTDKRRAVWFRYLLSLDSLTAVKKEMANAAGKGITFKRPIMPYPLHRYIPEFENCCPHADRLWETTVSVPLYPDLSEQEIDRVTRFIAGINERDD